MKRVSTYIILIILYACFSAMVYTHGTESNVSLPEKEMEMAGKGKILFQENNCIACHQIYGLGGYIGPDLTTAYSDKTRGEAYMRAILQTGGSRMPVYHFNEIEINSIIAYLKYVDSTATPVKLPNRQ